MRRPIALVFCAGVLFAQTPKPEPKGAIRGVVKDTSGIPVGGVSVTANPVLTVPEGVVVAGIVKVSPKVSASTDETGAYVLNGMAPGTYAVRAERDGAAIPTKQIKLDADQEISVDLVIPGNPSLSGRVVNQNREPAIDAFVWLLKPEYQAGVLKQAIVGPQVTGEDGTFAFDTGLEANRRYFVLVDRPPPDEVVPASGADLKDREPIEVPTYYPSATRMDSAAPVVLQPGERREQVEIKIAMAPFYCVDGKIQVSGRPSSSDFAIQDTPLAGSRLARIRGSAGEDGKFHACGLSPGSYRLTTEEGAREFAVSSSDLHHVDLSVEVAHLRLQVDWDGDQPPPETPKLDSAAQATLRKLAAQIGMGDAPSDDDLAKLAVRFSRADLSDNDLRDAMKHMQTDPSFPAEMWYLAGQLRPITDAVNVTLAGAAGVPGPSSAGRVPFEGPFKDNVPAGDYTVDVRSFGGNDSYVKEVAYNGLKLADGVLRVAPAASGTVRVLMARGTATLTVRVADTEGKSIPDATVMLVPNSVTSVAALSRLLTRGQTDQNGSYTSGFLTPGRYRVLATTQAVRWGAPEDLEKVLLVLFQAQAMDLDPKAKLQITVEPLPI